jgi:hypothetical protein
VSVTDPWGQPISCSAEVADTWGEAMERFHARRSGDVAMVKQVVDADPGFAVARATAALLAVFMDADFDAAAELAAAEGGRAEQPWERSFVGAAKATVEHGRWPAKQQWLAHHDDHPGDLMGFSVAAFLLIMGTEPDGPDRAEERGRRSMEHVGETAMLLGFLAMAAQDRGDLDTAHRLATRSLELEPAGFPGGHPMAHVYFESGDHANGIEWIDGWLPGTDQDAAFKGHLVWHSALHHLAVGDDAGALARYSDCGGAQAGGRLVDGPSLLWRCQLLGHVPPATDPESPPVASLATPMLDSVPFTFLGAHVALALATAGDADGLRRLAHNSGSFEVPGAADLLPDLALGLAAYVEGDHARSADALLRVEPHLGRLGGSHAQREVFEDTVVHALIRAGRLDQAATRLRARLDRRDSRLDTGLLARAEGARDKLEA